MGSLLEESWKEATEGWNVEACDNWFTRIQQVYSEEKRTFHNLKSVTEKLEQFYATRGFGYDPKALDEENKNLEFFTAFADEAGIPANGEIREATCALLRTAATHSTDAHKTGGVYGGEDAHYLLDLDMAILGAPPEKYAEYREKIRGEYSFLSEPMYTALRLKVLQNFLQIPNIFATKEFREKFEEQARQNIQTEVELLS